MLESPTPTFGLLVPRVLLVLLVVALLAAPLVLGACGDDEGNGSLIGATCESSAACGVAGLCVTDGQGGLCTLPCTRSGGPSECPPGAYCDDENVSVDDGGKRDHTLCFPACQRDSDCRDGYACNGVSSGPGKICNPK